MLALRKFVSKRNLVRYSLVYALMRVLFLLAPLATRSFIDSAVDKNLADMKVFGLACSLLFILTQLVMYVFDIEERRTTTESLAGIYEDIDHNLEAYHIKKGSLDRDRINQEITQNLTTIEQFIFEVPIRIVFSVLTMLVIFLIMLRLSVSLALIMVVVIPTGSYISYKLGDLISDYSEENLANTKDIKGFILDKYELTKSERLLFHRQLKEVRLLLDRYQATLNKKYKLESLVNNLMIYLILNGVILAMQLLSGYFVYQGTISIGTFFATQLYVSHFWTPVEYLFFIRNEYLTAKPAIRSFLDFMEVPLVAYDPSKIEEIAFDQVQALDSQGQPLHQPLSMTLTQDHIHVISGDNGTGKTTLVEALLNYTGRYTGTISINGQPLGDRAYEDMVYISVDYLISNYGILSDQVNFSSGQKKKAQIELATATDKSVYLIDEPTNFLDQENKKVIIDMIKDLYERHKLVVLISHDQELIDQLENPRIYYLKRRGPASWAGADS